MTGPSETNAVVRGAILILFRARHHIDALRRFDVEGAGWSAVPGS